MTHYLKLGSTVRVYGEKELSIVKELPKSVYIVKYSPNSGFYLEEGPEFKLPETVYGKASSLCERILRTFRDRTSNTGVLLSGPKGSGKTLLSKLISMSSELPVIIVNERFKEINDFCTFFQSIEGEAVVLFDEFEKVFPRDVDFDDDEDRSSQSSLLSLFDGVFSGKKLYILTCNDSFRISPFLKNRPGRIHYFIEFEGVEKEFIEQYCEKNLNNKNRLSEILNLSYAMVVFTFDMLQALVEEINRYDEPVFEALKILNIKMSFLDESKFEATVTKNKKLVKSELRYDRINPAKDIVRIELTETNEELTFTPEDIIKIPTKGEFVYASINGFQVVLKSREQDVTFIRNHLVA